MLGGVRVPIVPWLNGKAIGENLPLLPTPLASDLPVMQDHIQSVGADEGLIPLPYGT